MSIARPTWHRGRSWPVIVGTAVAVTLAACAPTPAPRPGYVTDFGSYGGSGSAPSSESPAARAPQWAAPQNDPIAWQDCTGQLAQRYAAPPAANTTLQCGTVTARLGPSQQPLRVAVTRAVNSTTPPNAAPVVLVGGTEFTGQRALTTMAAADSPLISARPVVAIERRGLGASSPLTCRSTEQRAVLRSGAQNPAQPIDQRIAAVSAASTEVATACGDDYRDTISDFTGPAAAEDIELLRTTWNVPALALLAVGDGSISALSFAALHPQQLARIALDSPVRYSAPELARAEDAAKGTAATLAAFAEQCGPDCALGADPARAVADIVERAATGRLAPFTDTDIRRAVIMTLGIGPGTRPARISALATVLDAARTGNPTPLRDLLRTADDAIGSDGQYLARCSDAVQKPSPNQIRDSAQKWGPQYPLGASVALDLGGCAAWPTMAAPPPLTTLEVRALVATSAADPLTSRDALETLSGQLTVAGAQPSAVTWGGIGDGAIVRSACAQTALVGYLDRAEAPSTRACPA